MSKNTTLPVTSLPKKWDKLIQSMPEFKDEADRASVDDLKKIVVQAEGNLYTIAKEKEADVKLSGAKEIVKDLATPYKESERNTIGQNHVRNAMPRKQRR